MSSVNDAIEITPEMKEALCCLFEAAEAADGDFCGEQRDWHLPRLQRAAALMVKLFPNHSVQAMMEAKSPYDREGT